MLINKNRFLKNKSKSFFLNKIGKPTIIYLLEKYFNKLLLLFLNKRNYNLNKDSIFLIIYF